jgi:glutathione S-transferase
MFMAEKGITGIEEVTVRPRQGRAQRRPTAPKARWPRCRRWSWTTAASADETRAICTYLEGLYPEPNLMGRDFEERAFIEMADRRIELYLFAGFANCIRHTHPGLAPLEQPQFPDFGHSQGEKVREVARWLDGELATRPM